MTLNGASLTVLDRFWQLPFQSLTICRGQLRFDWRSPLSRWSWNLPLNPPLTVPMLLLVELLKRVCGSQTIKKYFVIGDWIFYKAIQRKLKVMKICKKKIIQTIRKEKYHIIHSFKKISIHLCLADFISWQTSKLVDFI